MRKSHKPLISLVIPTRERSETLKFTLETALNQTNDNFEIIVSDNFSQDHTKRVVDDFADRRIKYINPGVRLSMVGNWNFAFESVVGEYVIFIGDDDGIMPGAIDRLQKIIEARPSPIYSWKFHEYTWPIDGAGAAITAIAPKSNPRELDLNGLVRFSVSWGAWRSYLLPGLYHSAVSRHILDEVRNKTGKVFHSMAPDIFMQFALPVFSNSAVHIGESLTVNGRSEKSNSGSIIAKSGGQTWSQFVREYGEYKGHVSLCPDVPVLINVIPDSVLVAMDLFPDYYRTMTFNYDAMWAYLHRMYKYETLLGILRRRKKIQEHHSFSALKFLFFNMAHQLLELRALVQRLCFNWKFNLRRDAPTNISDCVRMISELEAGVRSATSRRRMN